MFSLRSLWILLRRSGDQRDESYVGIWLVIGSMGVEEVPKVESAGG